VIDELRYSKTFAANGSAIGREIRVALNLGYDSIFDMDQYTTSTVTDPTVAFNYLLHTSIQIFLFFRLMKRGTNYLTLKQNIKN
jgi:hypothetical protein